MIPPMAINVQTLVPQWLRDCIFFVNERQKKRSKKIFGEKTERFQDLRGPWIVKIQGPQNLDFSPPPIHSGRT